jgi:hypothetical protein
VREPLCDEIGHQRPPLYVSFCDTLRLQEHPHRRPLSHTRTSLGGAWPGSLDLIVIRCVAGPRACTYPIAMPRPSTWPHAVTPPASTIPQISHLAPSH